MSHHVATYGITVFGKWLKDKHVTGGISLLTGKKIYMSNTFKIL